MRLSAQAALTLIAQGAAPRLFLSLYYRVKRAVSTPRSGNT